MTNKEIENITDKYSFKYWKYLQGKGINIRLSQLKTIMDNKIKGSGLKE